MGRVIPLETVGYYIPDSFIYLSRVGLKLGLTYLAGDVARRRALDLADGGSTGVDRVERGPREIKQHVLI